MKNLYILILLALGMTLFTSACQKNSDAAAEAKSAETKTQPEELGKAVDLEKLPTLEVPAEGTEFDPSVPVAQLPDGAWTCDMGGLSHYAAMHKKDGKCPICHMDLVQKKAE
jgi:hypothetical protein